jgi:ubiquinone biosynthesis protein
VLVLESELKSSYRRAFSYLDPLCLAAASIGQVHRARLRDGREVVVKVQRPGLRAQVDADLLIMRLFAQLLARQVPEVAAYQPVALVEAFARAIRLELDFRNEAENERKLRSVLSAAPEVHLPHVHREWTSERVLVMDYVAGSKFATLAAPARGRARQALLRAFVRQMIEHGVFHADPHPGNLLALPDGRVVLLDLGTVDVLSPALRSGLSRLCFALLFHRTRALCHEVVGLAAVEGTTVIDRRRLEQDLRTLLKGASQGGGAALVGQMMSVSRSHALRLPAPLLAMMRALAILDGVLRGLDPEGDVLRDLRRELPWALGRTLRARLRAPVERAFSGGARQLGRAWSLLCDLGRRARTRFKE